MAVEMPRGPTKGKPALQFVEHLAIFRAGEAASDAVQKNRYANRLDIAKVEYKAWLTKLANDPSLAAEGLAFVVKSMSDGAAFDVDASCAVRESDILKKHKEIIAKCKKVIMPAYFAFFTELGKFPSGTAREEAIKVVKEACWDDMEKERVAKLNKKIILDGAPPDEVEEGGEEGELESELVDADTACDPGEGEVADAGDAGDAGAAGGPDASLPKRGPKRLPAFCRPMDESWPGNHFFLIWLKAGPLAPEFDVSASLTGPGEVEGKPPSQSSRAYQRDLLKKKRQRAESSDDPGGNTPQSSTSSSKNTSGPDMDQLYSDLSSMRDEMEFANKDSIFSSTVVRSDS